MKVVLLVGGKGTRISEESQFKPKPMIEIGNMTILWHIMTEYSYYGFNDFVVCAGYKQDYIKQWFNNYYINNSDVTFDFSDPKPKISIHKSNCENWKVSVVDTGLETMTGGRIKRIKDYIDEDTFMMTYGDGVCDVDINELLKFHKSHGKIATLTSVQIDQDKGILDIDEFNSVKSFREKNISDGALVNAGYMVLNKEVFDYIDGDNTIFEKDSLEKLAKDGQLMSYNHRGFWQCMDNFREKELLERLIASGKAPWIKW